MVFRPKLVVLDETIFKFEEGPELDFFLAPGNP